MTKRTVITASKDGNILITTEVRSGVGGDSRKRRKHRRLGIETEWRRSGRTIVRKTTHVEWPLDDATLPKSWEELDQAVHNEDVANLYVMQAEDIVRGIQERNAAFVLPEPPTVVVYIGRERVCIQPSS